jgi:hypothetical protein
MYIDSYSFGSIIVAGKRYSSDLIIYQNKIDAAWWRKEGHRLYLEDLKGVIEAKPKILVIGTGKSGVMKVPDQVVAALKEKGIKVEVEKTQVAVKIYNDNNEQNIIGAFHLTC